MVKCNVKATICQGHQVRCTFEIEEALVEDEPKLIPFLTDKVCSEFRYHGPVVFNAITFGELEDLDKFGDRKLKE